MSSINFQARSSQVYPSLESSFDLPSETLIQATLSQDIDWSLCLKQRTAFDETKVRFFRNETSLKEYLSQSKKATV